MPNYTYQDNLESKRLLTRKLSSDDVTTWANFFRDDEATAFLPNLGFNSVEERATHWVNKQLNRYADHQFGLQVLIDKNTNEFIGQCGLLKQTIDDKTEIEVGYHIFKQNWGQGYATEAAKLFIDYAFQNKLTDSVTSIIAVNNKKSQRVADKNGLIREKQTTWSGLDVYIYRILK